MQEIVFGRNPNQVHHAFRYTDAMGLDRDAVMQAVLEDLVPHLPLELPPRNNRPFIGAVIVTGVELVYHAYPITEELVNVGSITELLQ